MKLRVMLATVVAAMAGLMVVGAATGSEPSESEIEQPDYVPFSSSTDTRDLEMFRSRIRLATEDDDEEPPPSSTTTTTEYKSGDCDVNDGNCVRCPGDFRCPA